MVNVFAADKATDTTPSPMVDVSPTGGSGVATMVGRNVGANVGPVGLNVGLPVGEAVPGTVGELVGEAVAGIIFMLFDKMSFSVVILYPAIITTSWQVDKS